MARSPVSRSQTQRGGRPGHQDLVSRAYDQLRTLIVEGRLAPGSRIIESDLAERLGVSRTPVRSALQRLQQERYVVALEGGKNARLAIAPLTAEDCREVLTLLGAVEGLATRWAAAAPEHRRQELSARMEEVNADFAEALASETPDPEEVFRLHSAFHGLPLESTGSGRVRSLHESIGPQAERYRRVYITTAPHGMSGEVEEHRAIVDAVARGDAAAAQTAVQENWERAAERLSKIVDRLGERGNW